MNKSTFFVVYCFLTPQRNRAKKPGCVRGGEGSLRLLLVLLRLEEY